MRIAVASDLHAYDAATSDAKMAAPSHLSTSETASATSNPLLGLQALIATNSLSADMLLCPGDLTDKAVPGPLKAVWSELQIIKQRLGASRLIATAGNHDVDSRYSYNTIEVDAALKELSPLFPGLAETDCDRYWSRHFVIIEEGDWRILVLNSSAFHGQGKEQGAEARHGRITTRTVDSIESALKSSKIAKINLLLCHHHLYRDNAVREKDYSEMEGADQITKVLGSGFYGQWLVIHGHKHHPKIHYGSGGLMSPLIFGAGSLSASLYAELAAVARNQFYIFEIDTSAAERYGMEIAGTVTAWDWIPNLGWQPAGPSSGLPHHSGFGYRTNVSHLSARVAAFVQSEPTFVQWGELLAKLPELAFVLHSDIKILLRHLESQHSIAATQDANGRVLEMGKI